MKLSEFKIPIFLGFMVAIYLFFYYVIPNSVDLFAFIPEKVYSGEWWRLFTYPLVHLNNWHLYENIFSMFLVGLLAFELKTEFYDFVVVFLSVGILAILPIFFSYPFSALGASAAIYGSFGLISKELTKFKVAPVIPLAVFTGVVFFNSIIHFFQCGFVCESFIFNLKQGVAHFIGLGMGYFIFSLMNEDAKNLHPASILRGVRNVN